jgi:hypothetical protein
MRSVNHRIQQVDRELLRFVGLGTDPQGRDPANRLLDERLILMDERDRGFRLTDRRRVTPTT